MKMKIVGLLLLAASLLVVTGRADAQTRICEAVIQFVFPGTAAQPWLTGPDTRMGLGLLTPESPVVMPSNAEGAVRVLIRDGSAVPFSMVPMYILSSDPSLVSFEPIGTLSCGTQQIQTYGGA